jgi:hypothetical protein
MNLVKANPLIGTIERLFKNRAVTGASRLLFSEN